MSLTVVKASDLSDDTFLYKDTINSVEVITSKSISELKTLLGLPSKVYKAFIDNTGTSNPTVTEITNNFTTTISWSRQTGGVYVMTCDAEFTANKTNYQVTVKGFLAPYFVVVNNGSTSQVSFIVYDKDGNLTDAIDFFVDIEVY